MDKWLVRGALITSALCVGVVGAASVKAAAVGGSAPASATTDAPASATRNETPLGDFIADALKAAAKSDLALVPANALQENAPITGTPEEIAKRILASPADETVVTLKVSGKKLRAALERSVALYPRKNQGFLQIAGLTVAFDPRTSAEERVTDVKVNGAPLQDEKEYTVAMPDSLARGGLGFFKFWSAKDAKAVSNGHGADLTMTSAVAAWLKDHKIGDKDAPFTPARIKVAH